MEKVLSFISSEECHYWHFLLKTVFKKNTFAREMSGCILEFHCNILFSDKQMKLSDSLPDPAPETSEVTQ